MQDWLSLAPEQASTFATDVDLLYYYLWALTAFFFVLLVSAIIYFAVKYRRRSDAEIPRPIAGSIKLETLWTVIPFILALSIFAWATNIYVKMVRVPAETMDIYVVGKQWMWKFQHPEGQREINELHLPVGKKVRMIMATEDVIHSMFIPAFRVKQDVVPGANRVSVLWFEPTKPGKYHIFCAEYCGTQHSGMIGTVTVMEPGDYQKWLSGGTESGTMASQGERMFTSLGCITCHQPGGLGPSLEGIIGKKRTFADGGSVVADENYVRQSILEPQAHIVAGYQPIMPTFKGQVSEDQLMLLIDYLRGGSAAAPVKTGAAGASPGDAKSQTETARTTESALPGKR